jgi:mRNA interferase MazF
METFVKGDIVVFPFPFSDLTEAKRRPAAILATLEGEDLIVCQITSSRSDKYSISLEDKDFKQGSLKQSSFIRPNRIFTISKSAVNYKIGSLKHEKLRDILEKLISILKQ